MRSVSGLFRLIIALLLFYTWSLGLAHHSPSNYDLDTVVEIEGEITRVLWRNPHVRFWVMPEGKIGEEDLWEMSATPVAAMARLGISRDLLNVGDIVRIAGSPARYKANEMLPLNILLPDEREILLEDGTEPRWNDNAIYGEEKLPEIASDPTLGIFRVWLSAQGGGFQDTKFTLTESARAVFEEITAQSWDIVLDGCTPKGMPEILAQPNPIEFSQLGDDIHMRLEEYDTVRFISMQPDATTENLTPTLLGHSVGEWQGETLIVTTTNIDYPWFRQQGIPQSEDMAVVERYTVNDEGSMLQLEMTVTDPATFIGPAYLKKYWNWRPGLEVPLYECAEE